MLVGAAAGFLAGAAATVLVHASVRPDVVIALVVAVPTVAGLVLILLSRRRLLTTLGAFLVAMAPGWFTLLVAAQVVSGAG